MMPAMEETLRQNLATCATAFEGLTGLKATVVSRRALQDSRYLDRVIGGEGFTIRTFDRVMAFLSAHWPDEADWPEGIERPAKAEWERLQEEVAAKARRRASQAEEAAA